MIHVSCLSGCPTANQFALSTRTAAGCLQLNIAKIQLRTVAATEPNRTEPRVCAGAGRGRRQRDCWEWEGREGGKKTGEGISSVEELRGVFFVACTTKSLTTNAKRRLHRLSSIPVWEVAPTWRSVIGLLLRSEMRWTVRWCEWVTEKNF